MSKNITIYTFKTCPFCIKSKELLSKEKVDYTEIEISNQKYKLDELEEKTGIGTVPQIFVNERFIGGCDDLLELHRNGKFDEIFK